ncbi:MAG: hypothetical protein Q9202_006673 [Teloschistes flavicans]
MTSLLRESFLISTLLALLLLFQHPLLTAAQSTTLSPSPTLNSGNPSLDIYGHTTDAFGTALPPPPTGTSIPTSSLDDPPSNTGTNNNILNYYFLLLALLIILIGIAYLVYARRQRTRIALSRRNAQRALARDLERWGGGSAGGLNRFRSPPTTMTRSSPRSRREEGLDERGEAPPPYLPKEPEPIYTAVGERGEDIPLREMGRDQKPPDYEEGPSSAATAGADVTVAQQQQAPPVVR